jgi:hypothetical protein
MSISQIIGIGKDLLSGGLVGVMGLFASKETKSTFMNVDSAMAILLIVVMVLSISLWVMSLIATYRLTNSVLQTILCFIFGSAYIVIAWIYYGMTNRKFVSSS